MKLLRKKIVVVSAPKLNDIELERAFVIEDTNRLWLAINQVIEMMIDECGDLAESCINSHGALASYVGASERLKLLRDRMFELRERGIQRQRNPEKAA